MNSEGKLGIVLRVIEILVISGTLVAIAISTFLMRRSVQQQYLFNQTSLKPWINCFPNPNISLISERLRLGLEYINIGKTPAFKLQTSTILYHGSHKIFKYNYIIFEDIVIEGPELEGIIFPNQTIGSSTSKDRIKGYSGKINKAKILEMISNRDFYLFVHVRYTDFDENENFWHFLFQPEILKETDKGFICEWRVLSVSTNDTLKNPKELSDTSVTKVIVPRSNPEM